jgi:hypothetical protein
MGAAVLYARVGELCYQASVHGTGSLVWTEHVTIKAAIWMFGFLLPIRRFNDRIASFGCTVFERMMSEISRLSAISSLLPALVNASGWLQ